MSWAALLELIVDEVGHDIAARIESRARSEMGGERLTITKRQLLTPQAIDAVAPGQPTLAAKKLKVHRSTVYRALARRRIIR